LIQLLLDQFSAAGLTVSVNRPYSGAMIPMRYFKKDFRVKSVMIEVNRSLYLRDEPYDLGKNDPGFSQLQSLLKLAIMQCTDMR